MERGEFIGAPLSKWLSLDCVGPGVELSAFSCFDQRMYGALGYEFCNVQLQSRRGEQNQVVVFHSVLTILQCCIL